MNKYIVEFTETEGAKYEFEFETEDIDKSISEYIRNRPIARYKVIVESARGRKSMLFG